MARPADPHAKEALLAAAVRAFSQQGLQRARIEDITQAAGLSKGAFYLHFESKEAAFGEAAARTMERMEALLRERREAYAVLAEEHRGALARGRVPPEAQAAFEAVDARCDRQTLEVMWDSRHVMDVLMRGSRGTEFEGVLWDFLDAEAGRIGQELEQRVAFGLCRPGLPTQVAGSMVVGTWLLLARSMIDLKEKPDLDFWVRSLKDLMACGIAPAQPEAGTARREAPRRGRRTQHRRRTRRTP